MIAAGPRGPVVIDTDVFSADLVPGSWLAEQYAPIITGRPALISFQTAAELRYGALRRGWGPTRMLKLDTKIQPGRGRPYRAGARARLCSAPRRL